MFLFHAAGDSFKVRVLYSYTPLNADELRINENDIVDVLRLVEDGWYEGICNGKQGVFPSNYVVKIEPSLNSSVDELEVVEGRIWLNLFFFINFIISSIF